MRVALIVLLFLLTGCAPATSGSEVSSRNVITRLELLANPAGNAYDAVQSLRPNWLRLRDEAGINRTNDLAVYVDNARMGGRESLREIGLGAVHSIRYLEPAAANLRWGTGHAHGVILVSTRAEEGS